jgi:hypothetical protein
MRPWTTCYSPRVGKNVFDPSYKVRFKAEPEFEVTGKVQRIGGHSTGALPVYLFSTKKPLVIKDTVTDSQGNFTFRNFPKIDTAKFMLQVKDKKGKIFEATINVDRFVPAATDTRPRLLLNPWYVNTDATYKDFLKGNIAHNQYNEQLKFPPGTHIMKEVVIKATKHVKGSHNLNGQGNADQIINEEDLAKVEDMPLQDYLYKSIKGFRRYLIYNKGLKFVVDGLDIDFFYNGDVQPDHYQYIDNVLSQFTVKDVKGVEILYSDKYNGTYTREYDPTIMMASRESWPAYMEITTWSGNGLFEKRKRSAAVFTPIPLSWPKIFYKPKYSTKEVDDAALGSTIYWEPNIITNNKGTAHISFNTNHSSSGYTVIVQGTDLDGTVGYSKIKISVSK